MNGPLFHHPDKAELDRIAERAAAGCEMDSAHSLLISAAKRLERADDPAVHPLRRALAELSDAREGLAS